MAVHTLFFKCDDLKGESIVEGHKDEIEIISFSMGGSNSGTMATGTGGGSGVVNFHDIQFTKYADSSSHLLVGAMSSGQHFKKGEFFFTKTGTNKDKQETYLTYVVEDFLISRWDQSHSLDASHPMENVGINFAKITKKYKPQGADGKLQAEKTMGWNVKENKKHSG